VTPTRGKNVNWGEEYSIIRDAPKEKGGEKNAYSELNGFPQKCARRKTGREKKKRSGYRGGTHNGARMDEAFKNPAETLTPASCVKGMSGRFGNV